MNLRPILLGQKPYIRCILAVDRIERRLASEREVAHKAELAAIYGLEPAEIAPWFNLRAARKIGSKRAAAMIKAQRS